MICFSLINTEGCSVLRPLFLHSERGVYFQLWEITHRRFKQWRKKTSSFLLGPTQPTKDYRLSQWKDGLRFTANAPWRRATISERTYNVPLQHLDASRSLRLRLYTDKARARWPGWYFFFLNLTWKEMWPFDEITDSAMSTAGSFVSLLTSEKSPSFLTLILDEWWVKNARIFLLLSYNKIKCIYFLG